MLNIVIPNSKSAANLSPIFDTQQFTDLTAIRLNPNIHIQRNPKLRIGNSESSLKTDFESCRLKNNQSEM